jgi:hypothetical protein
MNKLVVHDGQVTRPSERLASVRSDITGAASNKHDLVGHLLPLSRVNPVTDSLGRFPRARMRNLVRPRQSRRLPGMRQSALAELKSRRAFSPGEASRFLPSKTACYRTSGETLPKPQTPTDESNHPQICSAYRHRHECSMMVKRKRTRLRVCLTLSKPD